MEGEKKILHLTLKREFFDQIASGVKCEEYREWKPYWATRLCGGLANACKVWAGAFEYFKKYDIVEFKNGYSKNAPTMKIMVNEIKIGIGKSEWGATGNKCIIISLGKILSIKKYHK